MPARNQFNSDAEFCAALRDYFATHASEADIEASRIAGGNPDDPRIRCFARYRHADAMLRAREVQS